jgi:O-acetyl-ADP-ribose deacetylase (regulator of RNase III)
MIRVAFEPLVDVPAEALVRPIRSDLAPVTATARDLAAAAGPLMEERLERLGSLPVGGAVMTPAGDLRADFVIHAVVMSEDEPQTTGTVQRALRNGLARAADWGVESLALPPLGLGVGLTEPEDSAQALVAILANHIDEGRAPLDLTIVVTSSFEEELFTRLVAEATRERAD